MNPVMNARGVSYSPVSKCREALHPGAPRRRPWPLKSASDLHEALRGQSTEALSLRLLTLTGAPRVYFLPSASREPPRSSATIPTTATNAESVEPKNIGAPPEPVRSPSTSIRAPSTITTIPDPSLPMSIVFSPPAPPGSWVFWLRPSSACEPGWGSVSCLFRWHNGPSPNGDNAPARASRTVPAAVLSSRRIMTGCRSRRLFPRLAAPEFGLACSDGRPATAGRRGRSRLRGVPG